MGGGLFFLFMIIRAHRQRRPFQRTSSIAPPPSRAAGVTAASSPQSTRRGQALPPDLRPTRPTLTNIALPNRLPTQRPFQLQPRSMPPCGVYPLPTGGQGRPRQQLYRRNPIASQRFATPSSTTNKMRPAHPTQRQKVATLRRSGCFGFGQQGTQRKGRSTMAVLIFSGMPSTTCPTCPNALLPVPKALRPPLHLSKRMAVSRGALPQMRDSVRPLCV